MDHENYYKYCNDCGKIFEICPTIIEDEYSLMKQEGFLLNQAISLQSNIFEDGFFLSLVNPQRLFLTQLSISVEIIF